jgi:Sodium/hydrogen exchanger family
VVRRHLRPTIAIGVLSFLVPYLGVLAYAHYLLDWPWAQAQIAGIALSTTSVAVVYSVMVETKFNQTEMGKIILAACFVTDVGTVLALGIVFANYNIWLALFAVATALALWLVPRVVPTASAPKKFSCASRRDDGSMRRSRQSVSGRSKECMPHSWVRQSARRKQTLLGRFVKEVESCPLWVISRHNGPLSFIA